MGALYVATVLNLLAALAMERSEVPRSGEDRPDPTSEIRSIQRSVLPRVTVEGYDMLRIPDYRVFPALSERFRHAADCPGAPAGRGRGERRTRVCTRVCSGAARRAGGTGADDQALTHTGGRGMRRAIG